MNIHYQNQTKADMKKIVFIFFLVMWSVVSFGQGVVTASPSIFTGDDEVTFTFDVTGTSLEVYTGTVYLWLWSDYPDPTPDIDAPSNVSPANATAAPAILTQSAPGSNIYTITFVPSAFLELPAVQIQRLGLIAKADHWPNGKTVDLFLDVAPPIFDSPVVRVFPSAFSADDVVSIFYDTTLEENTELLAAGEFYLSVTINGTDINGDALNSVDYYLPIGESTKLVAAGNGLYRITFVPNKFFTLNTGDKITAIRYRIQNIDGELTNPPTGFDLLNTVVLKRAN